MKLHTLKPNKGAVKDNKRVGRGQGSGKGGTSTKGHKGGQSRSGYKFKAYFEGGQMPLSRRLPKFGFNNINRIEYQVVSIESLQTAADKSGIKEFDKEILKKIGLVKKLGEPVKILGGGELKTATVVKADAFSASAIKAIEAANGKAEKTS